MILPIIASFLLSSCTSTVSGIDTTAASLQPQVAAPLPAAAPAAPGQPPLPGDRNAPVMAMTDGAKVPLADPAQPALLPAPAQAGQIALNAPPVPAPADYAVAAAAPTDQQAISDAALQARLGAPAQPQPIIASAELLPATVAEAAPAEAAPAETPAATPPVQELTNGRPAQQFLDAAPVEPVKKPRKTLFASMFGDNSQKTTKQTAPQPLPAETQLALAQPAPSKASSLAAEEAAPKLSLVDTNGDSQADMSVPNADNGDLPGVRKGALFEIKRRDSLNSDADVDIGETDDGPILLASAGGLARLAPNGLKVQRESVDVACLKPQLVRMLKKIEAHYGRNVVVTSGYRSPGHNRRVRGAKNSLHMYCAAADIQIEGVGKWELAKYARSMPGRGGVGTYCHTDSIHVDIGPDRDWNWRCSRRK